MRAEPPSPPHVAAPLTFALDLQTPNGAIRGTLPLLDGGYLRKPEFSRYDVEGKKWIIEGYGVEPDIYVDNDPAKEYAGIDEQLNKAIEVILEELKTQEKEIPPLPPYPVK